jgi:hypothetical protein
MPTRGFTWMVYTADDSATWSLAVDSDYAANTDRGWSTPAPVGLAPFPRGWFPRKVFGLDATGRRQTAIVATTTAPLWVGTVGVFFIEATDGSVVPVTVGGRLAEDSRRAP